MHCERASAIGRFHGRHMRRQVPSTRPREEAPGRDPQRHLRPRWPEVRQCGRPVALPGTQIGRFDKSDKAVPKDSASSWPDSAASPRDGNGDVPGATAPTTRQQIGGSLGQYRTSKLVGKPLHRPDFSVVNGFGRVRVVLSGSKSEGNRRRGSGFLQSHAGFWSELSKVLQFRRFLEAG